MNKICLLAAVCALALCAQGSTAAERSSRSFPGDFGAGNAPKGAKLLYNQNSNDAGWGVNSQNTTSGAFGDAGADDFVVPKKTNWTVTEVDLTGVFYNGSGGGTENVIFYQDDHGLPGKAVKKGKFKMLAGDEQGSGSFAIQLPGHGLALKPGHYWVSVAVNCSTQSGCGEWEWEASSVVSADQAVWQGKGSKVCPSWGTVDACFGQTGDLMFDLRGTARRQ
jgi:hypothetical protein